MDKKILEEFRTLPGVGESIAVDLWNMGYRSTSELKSQDPEIMYIKINRLYGKKLDPCMLYVFRCIVYFVSTENPDPKLLKWWSWKDEKHSA